MDETKTEKTTARMGLLSIWGHKNRTESGNNKTANDEIRNPTSEEAAPRALGGSNPRSTTLIFHPKLLCV